MASRDSEGASSRLPVPAEDPSDARYAYALVADPYNARRIPLCVENFAVFIDRLALFIGLVDATVVQSHDFPLVVEHGRAGGPTFRVRLILSVAVERVVRARGLG